MNCPHCGYEKAYIGLNSVDCDVCNTYGDKKYVYYNTQGPSVFKQADLDYHELSPIGMYVIDINVLARIEGISVCDMYKKVVEHGEIVVDGDVMNASIPAY
jgi:hypothetical protein